jgi:lysine biosynthesis protein LysW
MAFAYCPDCAARIYLGRKPWVGQPVMCDVCDADLEVVGLNPPQLGWTDEMADGGWQEEQDLELEKA